MRKALIPTRRSIFAPTHVSIRQLRDGTQSTLIPSMYGGILTIDYSKKESGLLLTFPGKYSLNVKDSHTVFGRYLLNCRLRRS